MMSLNEEIVYNNYIRKTNLIYVVLQYINDNEWYQQKKRSQIEKNTIKNIIENWYQLRGENKIEENIIKNVEESIMKRIKNIIWNTKENIELGTKKDLNNLEKNGILRIEKKLEKIKGGHVK